MLVDLRIRAHGQRVNHGPDVDEGFVKLPPRSLVRIAAHQNKQHRLSTSGRRFHDPEQTHRPPISLRKPRPILPLPHLMKLIHSFHELADVLWRRSVHQHPHETLPLLPRPQNKLDSDPEILSSASNRPEQLLVLRLRSRDNFPVRKNHSSALQTINHQPFLPRKNTIPTAQRQSANTRVCNSAPNRSQPMLPSRSVNIPPNRSALDVQ